jgi:hypothetical protein
VAVRLCSCNFSIASLIGVAKASADGKSLYIGGDDLFHILDFGSGKVTQRIQLADPRGVAIFSPGENRTPCEP